MWRLDSWGASLTHTRDIALVGFGGVYAFGYLARALHAWENNLGVLPGVELQYFVAGMLLLVPPALVLAALFGGWRFLQAVAVWESTRPKLRQRIDALVGVLLLGGLLVFSISSAESVHRLVPFPAYVSHIAMAMFIGAFVVNAGLARARPPTPAAVPRSRVLDGIGRFVGGLFVVHLGLLVMALLLVAMLVGSAKVLPVLPQALGGAAPRCAQFDVDVSKVSPELVDALFEPGTSQDPSTAQRPRRSRQVLVHHSGGDSVLFTMPQTVAGPGPTYELKRSAIDAVLWCRKIGAART